MPVLHLGAEEYALQAGTYTLGGHGPNAIPLAALERSPEVATIVVPSSGASTIQRLTASVVVRLDRTPIGIGPKELPDGVEIEFSGYRLTFSTDGVGEEAATAGSPAEGVADRPLIPLIPESARVNQRPDRQAGTARLVNVRTGDPIDLGDGRVVLGRDEACDVVLPGMSVSRRHCSIMPVRGGYLLRDESANGTLVNGCRVSGTYLLGHGDIIRVAEEALRFEVNGEGDTSSRPTTTAAPTAILDLSRLRSEHAGADTAERPATPVAANLEVVRGPYAGASFSIDRAVCSIGRAAASDVRIPDESVSANHATLLRKGATWFVVDLRSANGTFVDGLRIAGERELTSGSRLKLGRVELMFRALDAGAETSVARRRSHSWLLELLLTPVFSRRSRSVSSVPEDAMLAE